MTLCEQSSAWDLAYIYLTIPLKVIAILILVAVIIFIITLLMQDILSPRTLAIIDILLVSATVIAAPIYFTYKRIDNIKADCKKGYADKVELKMNKESI